MKREFLMLAHVYTGTEPVGMWYMSEKLDGLRAFWDGGVTRGQPTSLVPWANTEKDARYITPPVSTGLWSRYGKAIQAPDWWLDKLPRGIPLDGELYAGRGNFQFLVSCTKRLVPGAEWHSVTYQVFDAPPYHAVFANGEIKNTNFKKKFEGIRLTNEEYQKPSRWDFHTVYGWLLELEQNDIFNVLAQKQLYGDYRTIITKRLEEVIEGGGEGLMLRNPTSFWAPQRAKTLLKVKGQLDSEATVVGYVWGRETDKGSKLLGLMGALVVSWKGKRFELSGFTDDERRLIFVADRSNACAIGVENPGKAVPPGITNPQFPIGSTVTFKYRELTDAGIPKEARYFRKREE